MGREPPRPACADAFAQVGANPEAFRPDWLSWALALGGTALILSAPPALAGLAAVGYVALTAWRPLPSLALIILSLPFSPLGRPIGASHFSPTEILIILASLAAGLRWLMQSRLAAPRFALGRSGDPILAGLVALVVLAGAVSLTASTDLRPSLRAFRTVILEPATFFFLMVTQVRRRRELDLLIGALVLSGVLISLVGGWQYLTNERIITAEEGLRRIRGFYGSPNNLGLYLGRILPFTLALALWRDLGRGIWIAAFLVIGLALLLTFSIGGWVATLVALYVVVALRGRRIWGRATLALLPAAALAVGLAAEVPRIGSHFDLESGTTFIRLGVWQSALHMLQDHPIRGIGLDNFLYLYREGYRLPAAWEDPNLSHPHNLLLDAWLSLGVAGPLLFGGLLGRLAQLIHRHWATASAANRAVFAGVIGGMVETLVHGLVDNSFFLTDLAVLFWFMFAIVAVLSRMKERPIG